MSYKDDEELNPEVDINEEEVDIIDSEDDALLIDEELLVDDELLAGDELLSEDEEDLEDFAGLDGSEY